MKEIGLYELIPFGFHPYDANAPLVFERVSAIIRTAIPNAVIEHIGSTAVPGLAGKGSINIFLAADAEEFPQLLINLQALGFQQDPFQNDPPVRPLCVGSFRYKVKSYPIHVHLTTPGSKDLRDAMFFREHLKQNAASREAYAKIKENAIAEGKAEPGEYNRAKAAFIRSII